MMELVKKISKIFLVVLVAALVSFAILPKNVAPSKVSSGSNQAESAVMNDFVVYYSVARIFTQIAPEKIYDDELNGKTQYEITRKEKGNLAYPLHYLYPPYTALLFLPFSYFSFVQAFYIWQLLLFVGVLLVLVSLYYAGICTSFRSFLLASFLITTSLPYMTSIAEGQPVIFMLLGLFACELLAKRNHFALAAILLVASSFKPQVIIAPVLYLLVAYGVGLWRAVIVTGLLFVVACTLIFGFGIWLSFVKALTSIGDNAQFLTLMIKKMCNFRTALLYLFGEDSFPIVNKISLFMWGASILAASYVACNLRYATQKQKELGFALVVVVACFFSPWLHIHTAILLVISVGYLLKYSGKNTLYILIVWLVVLNPFVAAALFPEKTHDYLALDLVLWIPAQIMLIATIAVKLIRDIKEVEAGY